jgi:hypothetical protein
MSSVPRPIASLAGVTLARRANAPPASEKSGDITGNLAASLPPPPAFEEPPPPAYPAEPLARAEEIVVYWERLRRGRPLPPLVELDRGLVGNSWPDSLIVAFEGGNMSLPRISRLGATNGVIEYEPMVTEWILSRARHAVRRAMKLDEVQSFPMAGDTPHYRMLLLPFGTGAGVSDSVLCHLSLAP